MKYSTQREVDKAAKKATEELQEMLQDTAHKVFNDQAEWLDKIMRDILPPHLYAAGLHEEKTEEIEAYLKKHGFRFVHVPDGMTIRIMRHDQIHAEFVGRLTLDGEEVVMKPTVNPGLN